MMTKRAVLYARVSKDDRDNDGRNLESQIEMGRVFAREHGYAVVAELPEDDRGASGAEFDLPMLAQALSMARGGEFDVLIVRELDRFARRLTKQLVVEEEFRRAGVLIEYVLGEYPDTPEGRLNKHIRATISEWEREKIAERMIRGKKNAMRRGGVCVANHPPYGYRVGRGADGLSHLEIEPNEARIVRQVFEWYVAGGGFSVPLSMRAIAQRLRADAVPSRGSGNQKRGRSAWNVTTVGRILAAPTYVGTWYYGKRDRQGRQNPKKDWMAVTVPAIIDRPTWEAAQERRRTNQDQSPRNTKRPYLLRRRVTCGACGFKMKAFSIGEYLYYNCPVGTRRHTDLSRDCGLPVFRADHVDFTVWSWLKELLVDESRLILKTAAGQAENERQLQPWRERLTIVGDLLADNRRQLEKLLDLYLSGEFDKSMLVARKTELEKTVAGLEAERGNLAALLAEQEFSAEQVEAVHELAAAVRADLTLADDPAAGFPIRAQIVDLLDVTAILKVEDGVKVAHVTCRIDSARLHLRFPQLVI